ncbi:MAG TPA: ribosomal-processing cysteine protease Prp [Thermoanaerobacterales bacterium]|nr:ribosomal-processing cysteine protease Prp [Thermoanaerobacterales bacterium]
MIKILVVRDTGGNFKSMEISGHAGFADYGRDIVCAGVSALVETCILGFENVAGTKPHVLKEEGYLLLELTQKVPEEALVKAGIIIETILLGLKDIAKSYPDYVQLETKKEVL